MNDMAMGGAVSAVWNPIHYNPGRMLLNCHLSLTIANLQSEFLVE